MYSRTLAAAALAAIAFAGCGGGKSTTTTTTTKTQTEAPLAGATNSLTGVAAVPADLNCGAVKPVWVNTRSKAYHEAGDPYYGRTKNGRYMCPAEATSAGYHAAGSAAGSSSMGGTYKHHKKRGGAMDNAPYATATP